MSYADIQMFMEKLNHLINYNTIPSINHPEIICERPQFQRLYEDLGSMIQTLFIHQHQDLQKLIDLKQRFIHAAEEAEYNVDLFLSAVHIWNTFDDVRRSFKSVEMKFTRKYDTVMMLMDKCHKLNQLINFSNYRSNIAESRQQLRQLYDELDSMTQTTCHIFLDYGHKELIHMKEAVKAAAVADNNSRVNTILYDVSRLFESVEMKFTSKYANCNKAKMLMDKLMQLINIFNFPSNIGEAEWRQLQRLYDELDSMTNTLFTVSGEVDDEGYQHDSTVNDNDVIEVIGMEITELIDMKKTVTAAAVALYGVLVRNNNRSLNLHDVRRSVKSVGDLFLSSVHIRNNGSEDFKSSLNLNDVRISLMFIKAEFKSMRIDGMKMDSSPKPQRTLNQSVAGQSSIFRGSKKAIDEIFVGLDRDAELIRDKLVEDQRKLDVVSIVGTGGIGKTTLATKVFNDGFVRYHFHVRAWVTVSVRI